MMILFKEVAKYSLEREETGDLSDFPKSIANSSRTSSSLCKNDVGLPHYIQLFLYFNV